MKTLLLYLALVGLPLLGVSGILRAGSGLVAPPSFGGTWALATADAPGGCARPAGPLRVTQSGRRAQVTLGAVAAGADVDGRRLRTRGAVATAGPCAGWRVEAEGVGGPVPEALTGRLVPEGCACAPVPFRASRRASRPSATPPAPGP